MSERDYEPASYQGRLARTLSGGNAPGRGGRFRQLVPRGSTNRLAGILEVDPALFSECILSALAAGRGVLLASTSDGGALNVTLFEGDERSRTYASTPEEFSEALIALRGASEARRSGRRGGTTERD